MFEGHEMLLSRATQHIGYVEAGLLRLNFFRLQTYRKEPVSPDRKSATRIDAKCHEMIFPRNL